MWNMEWIWKIKKKFRENKWFYCKLISRNIFQIESNCLVFPHCDLSQRYDFFSWNQTRFLFQGEQCLSLRYNNRFWRPQIFHKSTWRNFTWSPSFHHNFTKISIFSSKHTCDCTLPSSVTTQCVEEFIIPIWTKPNNRLHIFNSLIAIFTKKILNANVHHFVISKSQLDFLIEQIWSKVH